MKMRIEVLVLIVSLVVGALVPVGAQTTGPTTEKKDSTPSTETKAATPATPAYATLLKDATSKSGLWTVYQKGQNLYWEIGSGDYSAEYIVLISISRGIGLTCAATSTGSPRRPAQSSV